MLTKYAFHLVNCIFAIWVALSTKIVKQMNYIAEKNYFTHLKISMKQVFS